MELCKIPWNSRSGSGYLAIWAGNTVEIDIDIELACYLAAQAGYNIERDYNIDIADRTIWTVKLM